MSQGFRRRSWKPDVLLGAQETDVKPKCQTVDLMGGLLINKKRTVSVNALIKSWATTHRPSQVTSKPSGIRQTRDIWRFLLARPGCVSSSCWMYARSAHPLYSGDISSTWSITNESNAFILTIEIITTARRCERVGFFWKSRNRTFRLNLHFVRCWRMPQIPVCKDFHFAIQPIKAFLHF